MDFDYDFFKQIIIVIIPIVLGFFVSNRVLHSWQLRKEQFQLKRNILEEFDKTIPYSRSLIFSFYHEVLRYCSSVPQFSKTKQEKYLIKFDTNKINSNPISKEFEEKYEEFSRKYREVDLEINRFSSTVMLYFKDESIKKKFSNLLQDDVKLKLSFDKLFYSIGIKEFLKNFDLFEKSYKENSNAIFKFRSVLIDGKLKNPQI